MALRGLAVGIGLLLFAAGCSSTEPGELGSPQSFVGRWTNEGPAPLSQGITGLDIRRRGEGYSGTLFLSGRAVDGSGGVRDGQLMMRFPTPDGAFAVSATLQSDSTVSVSFTPSRAKGPIAATLTRH